MRGVGLFLAIVALLCASPAQATSYQPGTFSIGGIPIQCGSAVFVLDESLEDIGMEGYGLIFLNPNRLAELPTALQLWWVGHECGHYMIGTDEAAADCWSVQTGRLEGWFPAGMFGLLEGMFADNPGDEEHLSGPERVNKMKACYYTERAGGTARAMR